MKRTLILTLSVLCLILAAVLLASCGGGDNGGSTGGSTVAATTDDGHNWDEGRVIAQATCSNTGTML